MTDKFGVGICMEEIQKELSKENGEDIPEMLIETLLWNGIQGRMLGTDPVKRGLNGYAYCGNDPVN